MWDRRNEKVTPYDPVTAPVSGVNPDAAHRVTVETTALENLEYRPRVAKDPPRIISMFGGHIRINLDSKDNAGRL